MEIRWFAHSWYQIRSKEAIVHIDPSDLSPRTPQRLPKGAEKADLVLITHHHADHCRREIVSLLSTGGTRILAPSVCSRVLGGDFVVMKPRDTFGHAGLEVRAVDAYNTPQGASTVKAHRKGDGLGYLITAEGKTVYHAGDTDMIPEMGALGRVDVALLPIGGTYTMDAVEAAAAVGRIKPGVAIPMHYLDADPRIFAQKVGGDVRVTILQPGEAMTLA